MFPFKGQYCTVHGKSEPISNQHRKTTKRIGGCVGVASKTRSCREIVGKLRQRRCQQSFDVDARNSWYIKLKRVHMPSFYFYMVKKKKRVRVESCEDPLKEVAKSESTRYTTQSRERERERMLHQARPLIYSCTFDSVTTVS